MKRSDDEPLAPRHRKAVSVSVRIYRKLLLAYPESFREEYASEMVRYFEELCEDSLRRGGIAALVAMWVRTLSELAVSARIERDKMLPQEQREPSEAVLYVLFFWPGAGQAYNGQPIKAIIHAMGCLALLAGGIIWSVTSGPGYVWLIVVCLMAVYSTVDAWITARKINAELRVRS